MTATTTTKRAPRAARRRPVPWTKLAWVTWRQHRPALTGAAAFLGLVSLYLLIMGLKINHAYAQVASCHPASSGTCQQLLTSFSHAILGRRRRRSRVRRRRADRLQPDAGGAGAARRVPRGAGAGPRIRDRDVPVRLDPGVRQAPLGGQQAGAAGRAGDRGHLGVHRAVQLVLPRFPGRRTGEQAAAAGVRPARRGLRRLDAGRLRPRRVLRGADQADPAGDGRHAGHLDRPGHRHRGRAAAALPGAAQDRRRPTRRPAPGCSAPTRPARTARC